MSSLASVRSLESDRWRQQAGPGDGGGRVGGGEPGTTATNGTFLVSADLCSVTIWRTFAPARCAGSYFHWFNVAKYASANARSFVFAARAVAVSGFPVVSTTNSMSTD